MKIIRKIGAVFVVLSLVLGSIFIGASAEDESQFPATDTTLNFLGADYANSVSQAYEQYEVFQYDAGLLAKDPPNSYVVYKMKANSPVVATFKYVPTADEKPEFYTSPDGKTWTSLNMMIVSPETQIRTWYSNGIGAENKFIKIVICDQSIAEVWRCDLRELSFNASDESGLTMDTTLDFYNNYADAVAHAYKCSSDIFQVYNGGVSGTDTPNSYIIFKVEKNSPVNAYIQVYPDSAGNARPKFQVSPDAETWTDLSMAESKHPTDGNALNYYTPGIGADNKYIKITISTGALAEAWFINMRQLSYCASTESEDVPLPDTTLNFIENGKADLDRVFRYYNFAISPAAGYENAAYATKENKNYVMLNTAYNSPFEMHLRAHDSVFNGQVTILASSDPNDPDSWKAIDLTKSEPKNPGYDVWTYYTTGIGDEYNYVKISLSIASAWAFCIQDISYSAGTHIGPDDSGYVEPEVPEPDTELDFLNNYDAALQKAYDSAAKNDPTAISNIYNGGIGGSKGSDSYLVYRVNDNSPIVAKFKIFAGKTDERPLFYASPDGKNWKECEMLTDRKVTGTVLVNYYTDGIGEGNNYFKIVFGKNPLTVDYVWYIDLQNLKYNVAMPKTDSECEFLNGYDAAIEKAYMFSADVGHIYQGGIGGSKGGDDSYITYKVDDNSPIIATFKIFANDFAGRPQFYASADGKEWNKCEMSTDVAVTGTVFVRYYTDGIGKGNKYFKVVFSDKPIDLIWHVDMQNLKYNASKEPLPYDLNLSFTGDALALARIYSINPADAFEQLLSTGLILTVDYLSGQQKVAKPRMTIAVKPQSGVLMQFKVSVFADALKLFPKFYASTDGKKWDEVIDYILFSTGSDGNYISYRATVEPLNKKYEFFSFEYPQTKDYAGIDIAELDDYVPDCLNSGIILTNIQFMRSEKYVGLEMEDLSGNTGGDEDEDDDTYYDDSDEDLIPDTGDKYNTGVCIMVSAVCLFAVVILKSKIKKGDKV